MSWRTRCVNLTKRTVHRLEKRMARLLARWLSPSELGDIAGETLPGVLARVPEEQRIPFLLDLVQRLLSPMLSGLERQQRAQLMNQLLPLVAQEFPLSELDFLSAFGGVAPEEDDDE